MHGLFKVLLRLNSSSKKYKIHYQLLVVIIDTWVINFTVIARKMPKMKAMIKIGSGQERCQKEGKNNTGGHCGKDALRRERWLKKLDF
jgi:hypothetical protein